ncbi:hypothetical protein CEXT_59221 [Caerostris extrusa]|uniref:Uncharacterized protein n=1 Tax=Caerostris extrusa TaxID=172846 RepID=A0AAV4MEX4_CAEEX|nr:hypothetical protein CEXT_59221 [Caerostris extrusa]
MQDVLLLSQSKLNSLWNNVERALSGIASEVKRGGGIHRAPPTQLKVGLSEVGGDLILAPPSVTAHLKVQEETSFTAQPVSHSRPYKIQQI